MKNIIPKKINFIKIWIFISWTLPIILYLVYLTFIIIKEEMNMETAIWTTAAIVSVAIIGLIGTIISVNGKIPKIKDTDKIKKEIEIVNGKIGEVNNCSLIGQHYNIIEILNKNLESDQSNILKNLNNINNYVKNEEFKKEFLGKNYDYLKLLENERFNDKKIIWELNEILKVRGFEFEREVIKIKEIIKEKDKEIKDLEQKIQYLNKNKGKGYER